MVGHWEHIHGLDLLDFVAVLSEVLQVAGEGLGVAGDIDHLLGSKSADGAHEVLVASGAGWIHEYGVHLLAFGGHIHHELAGISVIEVDIFGIIHFCVADGILDGVGIHLNTNDISGLLGGDDADGADSAVGIDDGLLAGKLGIFDGCAIEDFSLDGVDLIEGLGGDAELAVAELVHDISRAVESFLVLAKEHGGELVVHVLNYSGYFRVEGAQFADKVVLCWEDGGSRD